MIIELSNDQLALLLKVLGKEKAYLNAGGFYASAHLVSALQEHLKNNAKEGV
jgi:hypothetical protein